MNLGVTHCQISLPVPNINLLGCGRANERFDYGMLRLLDINEAGLDCL